MNIIISKPQLVKVVLRYIKNNFDNLTTESNPEKPDSIYYVDENNQPIMEYEPKYNDIWINQEKFWSKIETLFSLSYPQTQLIIKEWLGDKHKIKKAIPRPFPNINMNHGYNPPNYD